MNSGIPWQVRGVRPEARDTAREAARRSGLSVGEWLNSVIIDKADDEGVAPPAGDVYGEDPVLSAVNTRLDDLSRQLDTIARNASGRGHGREDNERVTQAISRLDQRLDQLISENRASASTMADLYREPALAHAVPAGESDPLDQAIAEITARQQALDHNAAAPLPPQAPPRRPLPERTDVLPRPATQELGGLERQLRQITTQIESLRAPELQDAVAALRGELGEIAHALQDALPRRSIEALEKEIRKLAERINQTRGAGVDGSALSALEQGLIEMRDAVRALTPAENLGALHLTIEGLARKIDAIAGGSQDPRALQQLEEAIATLRGVVSHVASNDSLNRLAEEMRTLATNVDRVARSAGSSEILSHIDQRISSLAQALEAQRGGADEAGRFEAVAKSLNEKLEKLSMSRGDHAAVGALEDRIAKLVEKLDASGARLNHLEAIEHALAELLVHLEQQRAQNGGAPRSAGGVRAGHDVGTLKRDIDEIKQVEQRTQDSLEVAHGTLGAVVDRLAMIETDMRGEAKPAAAAPTPRPRATNPLPAEPPPAPRSAPPQAIERRPIDPTLPPDHPLEPGLGASPSRAGASPAARIAASEAALGRAKPPVIPDPGGKGDFIAAARRAAQAASMTAAADATPARAEPRPEPRVQALAADIPSDPKNERGGIAKRVRSLFVGASVVAIVVGSLHLTAKMIGPVDEALKNAVQRPAGDVTAAAPRDAGAAPPMSRPAAPAAPARIPEPARPSGAGDITGSVRPAEPSSSAKSPQRAMTPDQLPTTFSLTLRNAAASGDGPAAFEVASRYAEGRGVPQNGEEAARWFERAANRGIVPAKFRLASLYEKGIGVKKSLETARRLYLAAAEAGSGKAMHNLAVLHAEGIDGKPDYRNALHWFRKGAEHGMNDSQYNLGVLYARGIGVETNLAESFKWFSLAARDGDKDAAKKRDDVAARLDPHALAAARLALQNWMPQPQPPAAVEVPVPAGGWDGAAGQQSAPEPPAQRGASATGGPHRPVAASRRSSQ